jgi:8-oxo-dGTP diphosphatase
MTQDDERTPELAIEAVGALAYRITPKGALRVLLIRKRGGAWSLPKGHIEPGEDDAAALARELAEETGLAGRREQLVHTITYPVLKRGQRYAKTVRYYLVHAERGRHRPSKTEGIERVVWVSPEQALRRLRNPRTHAVAELALALLGRPPDTAP